MLAFALLTGVLATGSLAAPAPKVASKQPALSSSTLTVPITAVVPRSERKKEQLSRHIALLREGIDGRWAGDGATYEFFGPGSGVEYAVNVTVAGQNVSVIFDTGSSDLWFPANNFTCLSLNGTEIDQATCDFGPTYFDITTASAAGDIVPLNFTNNFNISYGDGEYATGSGYVGPVGFAGLTVKNTEFSVVEEAYWTGDTVTDGLIGFANPLLTSIFAGSDPTVDNSTNAREYLPWFYQANADGLVAPYFSIALNRVSVADEFEDDGEAVLTGLGSVTLGGIPSNTSVPVTGKNVTVPNVLFNATRNGKKIQVPAYYTVPIDSWDFPGSDQMDTQTPLAILDSGTTLLYAPDDVAYAFNEQIRPTPVFNETQGAYIVECNATVPELAVTIAGTQFFFEAEDLVFAFEEPGLCYSSVIPGGNSTTDVFILGDRFLVNVIASFNIESNEISIYERVPY